MYLQMYLDYLNNFYALIRKYTEFTNLFIIIREQFLNTCDLCIDMSGFCQLVTYSNILGITTYYA